MSRRIRKGTAIVLAGDLNTKYFPSQFAALWKRPDSTIASTAIGSARIRLLARWIGSSCAVRYSRKTPRLFVIRLCRIITRWLRGFFYSSGREAGTHRLR